MTPVGLVGSWSCFNEAPAKRGGIGTDRMQDFLDLVASMRPPQNAGGICETVDLVIYNLSLQ